jgi:two-component system, LytTR family, response regulator
MNESLKLIIADDEPLARNFLKRMLAAHPDATVVAEAGNGVETIERTLKFRPDLLFLDVQMPVLDGFGVLETLGEEHCPVVVFTTAFDEFALRAFEHHAVDYLLKPFTQERFDRAYAHAAARARSAANPLADPLAPLRASLAGRAEFLTRLVVRQADRAVVVRVAEVDWFEADDKYVLAHVGSTTHCVRQTLATFAARLDPGQFVRVHRSIIVNLESVVEIEPLFNGEGLLVLRGGARIPLGRTYRDRALAALGAL